MHRIDEYYKHCVDLKRNADKLAARYKTKQKTLENLTDDLKYTEEALELAKELVNDEADRFIKTVEGLLTMAVEKIFYDVENPKINIVIKEGARNSAYIEYEYTDYSGTRIKSDVRKATGGGVRAVVGFVLQVFFISYYKLNRFIFGDECFKELSKNYRPKFIEFLKELSESSNFKFLLITHDDDIVDSADYIYKMEDGELRKLV